ncbi:MAG: transposase [Candidatus Dormibacteria bacterium]
MAVAIAASALVAVAAWIHDRVNHSANVYVDGDVCTRTIESFLSPVKSWIRGTYHSVSSEWLQVLAGRVRLAATTIHDHTKWLNGHRRPQGRRRFAYCSPLLAGLPPERVFLRKRGGGGVALTSLSNSRESALELCGPSALYFSHSMSLGTS